MKILRWSALLLAALAFTAGADACIKALTLPEMVEKADTAVLGEITHVRSVMRHVEGEGNFIYTLVSVEGQDLYTGQARTIETAFLGGNYQGESMLVTSMPSPSEYKVGNEVVVFSAPVGDWHTEIERSMYAAMGGIFRVHNGVVFGKGEGFAVERNQRVETLTEGIQNALVAKQQGGRR
jgi:hypothetical protein